jgi:hypothetical protein
MFPSPPGDDHVDGSGEASDAERHVTSIDLGLHCWWRLLLTRSWWHGCVPAHHDSGRTLLVASSLPYANDHMKH